MKNKNNNKSIGVKIIGVLQKHKKGYGFVTPKEEIKETLSFESDIFIASSLINGAMSGDTVEVDLIPEYLWGNSPEGIITKVLDRKYKTIVGTFEKSKKFGFVVPEARKVNEDVFIRKKFFNGAKTGDKVLVKILRYPEGNSSAEGKIEEIVARRNEVGADITAVIRANGLNKSFDKNVRKEAKKAAEKPLDEEIKRRRDLRNLYTVTIDGKDSKDFDDAVSIELLENGNYMLSVHIADVAHYVKEGSMLDKEAFNRGNSVYLINQVVPMLPNILSNGMCSLNPKVDRLALTCQMQIDKSGKVIEHEIFESVIQSNNRLIYDDVSDILEQNDKTSENEYLFQMQELAEILRCKKEKRGGIDFNIDEAKIMLDELGKVKEISVAERRIANRIIEEFMLLANETVAEHFFWMQLPFVYRVHNRPDINKMENLNKFLKSFSLNIRGDLTELRPNTISKILKETEGKNYERIVNSVILKSMQKASYEVDCEGHFGLALQYYCHFTSPIRRYPDLQIHRIIKRSISGDLSEKDIKFFEKKCIKVAEHSSETERQAIDIERDVEKMKMAEYMSEHIGEIYEGVISSVTAFGIYVELDNCIEGMIRLDNIRDDYYEFISEQYKIVGTHTGKTYALGDKVSIKVIAANKETREIDFILYKF